MNLKPVEQKSSAYSTIVMLNISSIFTGCQLQACVIFPRNGIMIGIDEDIFFSWVETTKWRLLSVIIPYIFTYIFVITSQKTWIEVSKIVRKFKRDILDPFFQFLDLDSCHNHPGAMLMFRDIGPEGSLQKDVIVFSNVHHLNNYFFGKIDYKWENLL